MLSINNSDAWLMQLGDELIVYLPATIGHSFQAARTPRRTTEPAVCSSAKPVISVCEHLTRFLNGKIPMLKPAHR